MFLLLLKILFIYSFFITYLTQTYDFFSLEKPMDKSKNDANFLVKEPTRRSSNSNPNPVIYFRPRAQSASSDIYNNKSEFGSKFQTSKNNSLMFDRPPPISEVEENSCRPRQIHQSNGLVNESIFKKKGTFPLRETPVSVFENKYRINLLRSRRCKVSPIEPEMGKRSPSPTLSKTYFATAEKIKLDAKAISQKEGVDTSIISPNNTFIEKFHDRASTATTMITMNTRPKTGQSYHNCPILAKESVITLGTHSECKIKNGQRIEEMLKSVKQNIAKSDNTMAQEIIKASKLKDAEYLLYKLSVTEKDYFKVRIPFDNTHKEAIDKILIKRQNELDKNLIKRNLLKVHELNQYSNKPKKETHYLDDRRFHQERFLNENDGSIMKYIKRVDRDIWNMLEKEENKEIRIFDNDEPVAQILNKLNEYYLPRKRNRSIAYNHQNTKEIFITNENLNASQHFNNYINECEYKSEEISVKNNENS